MTLAQVLAIEPNLDTFRVALPTALHRVASLPQKLESTMAVTYAIGDIHGRDALLERLHARIIHDPYRSRSNIRPTVVHLGDYIDGGPASPDVIDRVMRGAPEFETVALLGNHEMLMLECLETDDRDTWWNWISNGGEKTLEALGIPIRTHGFNSRALKEALGTQRIEWLRSLPLSHIIDGYLFVHAGIAPGVPLDSQHKKDLLWIRSRFLECDANHGYIVVHGHTQTIEPELRKNRIGIDTGEARPKTLTAVALDGTSPPRFLSVSEEH